MKQTLTKTMSTNPGIKGRSVF